MSDEPRRKPSTPSMVAFVPGNGDEPHRPLTRPTKRPPEAIELLLEDAVAKLAALDSSVEKLHEDLATKEQVKTVYEQARRTHRLLEQHLKEVAQERLSAATRQDAIMSMLSQILARLPDLPRPSSRPIGSEEPDKI